MAGLTGWALCGHNAAPGSARLECADGEESDRSDEDAEEEDVSQPVSGPAVSASTWPAMSREQRMALGLKCKVLIDKGRWWYAAEQMGLEPASESSECAGDSGVVRLVCYIRPEVSGENRLLVVGCPGKSR